MGSSGGMDVRLPMGLMFCIVGALIAVYGLATWGNQDLYDRSFGINVNICWGSTLFLFGLALLGLVWWADQSQKKKA
jgi:hypothetical protein